MKRVLTFSSAAVADDCFVVLSFSGREAMSALFSYDIEVMSRREDIDFDAMLQEPSWLGVQKGVNLTDGVDGVKTLKIHGVVSEFSQLDQGEGWTRYRLTLVPALWRSSLNAGSRIFMGSSAPQIVERLLNAVGFTQEDYDLRLDAERYPKREYIVQYGESDLHFISRLLEHEGIFYYFVHREGRSQLVLGDSPDACERLPEPATFRQSQQSDTQAGLAHWNQPEAIHGMSCRQSAVAAEIVLQDYNYRSPDRALLAKGRIADKAAFGTIYSYGDHYKDRDEGASYARVRSEEIACGRRVFTGHGDVRSFRTGSSFSLQDHYRDDFNAGYLLTEVDHRGSQVVDRGSGVIQTSSYENRFACIRDDVPFRPRRTTPKPRIAGALNALIDAAGAGEYAELDDQGRYKVRLPLDLDDRASGDGSRFVRMAQPYAGEDMGMHFPLHKGTEVLLTHVNGDPDRPVIAGAVSNPGTANVVRDRNQSQGVLRSAGHNELRFDDASGGEELYLHAQRDQVVVVRNDERISVGRDHTTTIARDRSLDIGRDVRIGIAGKLAESIGSHASMSIVGDAQRSVGGSDALSVAKDRSVDITGSIVERIGADVTVEIGGDVSESIAGDRTETIAATRTITADKVVMEAAEEIILRAGKASLTLRADGTIAIDGGDVRTSGSGSIAIRAAKQVAIRGAKVTGN
ncbi:MAG: type VI secretion system tip protein VgrG [Planctomycetes bacterium]|nr:type VI secretion system tip protein VgrG [Planctomycetota bacterium]